MHKQTKRLYECGPFLVDPENRILARQGEPIPLPPKAFETLLLLIEQRGALLEKELLLKTVWPDTFVEENNLTQYVSLLRRVLGDNAGQQQYIETVPKLGYRFVAPVREVIREDGDLVLTRHMRARIVVREEEEVSEQEETPPVPVTQTASPGSTRLNRWSKARWLHWTRLAPAVAAVVVLAVFAVWHFRRPPALTERDSILLAGFENSTGETVFDDTLRRALAIKLEESPFLNVVPDSQVRDTLRFMGRSADEHLDATVAREACERRQARALVTGSIARLGSHYVVAVEALNCATGDSVARELVDVEGKEAVLPAMGTATSRLRAKLGESLSSIQKYDSPIEEATTSSLEALKAFSLGEAQRAKGLQIESIPFYERALEMDPDFAMAYGRLGVVYFGIGEPDRGRSYSKKAFELRQRASERERLSLSAYYYHVGLGDFDKAETQYQVWEQTYPRDFMPHSSSAALYNDAGQFDRALAEGREALRLSPGHALVYNTAGWAALRLGRIEEAKSIFDEALAGKADSPMIHRGLYSVAFLQGDGSAMLREAQLGKGKPDEYRTVVFEAQVSAFSGKLAQARESFRRTAELARQNHFDEPAAAALAGWALLEASLGNLPQARSDARDALEIAHGRDALGIAASTFALAGDTKAAQQCMDELARDYPGDTLVNSFSLPSARAAIELERNHPLQAVQELRVSKPYEFGPFVFGQGYLPGYLRGQAYLKAKNGAEAANEFRGILEHRSAAPFAPLQALAHLGLARALALNGDRENSKRAYEEFLTLWKEADPNIPLVRAARTELSRLQRGSAGGGNGI